MSAVESPERRPAELLDETDRGTRRSPPAAASQHLKVLKEAQLVTARAEGTRRVYAVDPRGIEAIRNWFDGFWDETLDAFKAAAEREASKEKRKR